MGEQQGTSVRFLPSRKLTQLQGHFPENSDHYFKNRPQLSQHAQPSILNSKNYKLSQMMQSVPAEMPLMTDIAKCDIHHQERSWIHHQERSWSRRQRCACTSSSTPGKGLKPRNPALRTDNLFHLNSAEDHSFLDSKTERKMESDITQLSVKCRRRPYLQILEANNLTLPGVQSQTFPRLYLLPHPSVIPRLP